MWSIATGETCGDCVDNDGNGRTDFEEPLRYP